MSQDAFEGAGLIPFAGTERSAMNPLATALVTAYTGAVNRFQQITKGVDFEKLPEPDRSGCILIRKEIESLRSARQQSHSISQEKLIAMAVDSIDRLVDNLPTWVPVLFADYQQLSGLLPKDITRLLVMSFFADGVERYFGEDGAHDFILDCLAVYQDSNYTVERSIGDKDKPVRLLDLDKILSRIQKAHYEAEAGDVGPRILRRVMHQTAKQTPRVLTNHLGGVTAIAPK
ncbi:hypothetical protein FJY90_03160 [Candidatus Gottesmanbacteria bacterium]|nr:hypothetical protein [Candidatus Gottesmanbacteria bacterium]